MAVKIAGQDILKANCSIPHHTYSIVTIGAGMYPQTNLTSVYVKGKSKQSFLVFAGPQPYPDYPYGPYTDANGTKHNNLCSALGGMETFPFHCCFVSLTTAAACYKNKDAQIDPKNAQLQESYIDAKLIGLITVDIGGWISRCHGLYTRIFSSLFWIWNLCWIFERRRNELQRLHFLVIWSVFPSLFSFFSFSLLWWFFSVFSVGWWSF